MLWVDEGADIDEVRFIFGLKLESRSSVIHEKNQYLLLIMKLPNFCQTYVGFQKHCSRHLHRKSIDILLQALPSFLFHFITVFAGKC